MFCTHGFTNLSQGLVQISKGIKENRSLRGLRISSPKAPLDAGLEALMDACAERKVIIPSFTLVFYASYCHMISCSDNRSAGTEINTCFQFIVCWPINDKVYSQMPLITFVL